MKQLADKLFCRYSHLVKEIVAQKELFPNELEYSKCLCKYMQRLNYIQGVLLKIK
jgi:hypothetical protein